MTKNTKGHLIENHKLPDTKNPVQTIIECIENKYQLFKSISENDITSKIYRDFCLLLFASLYCQPMGRVSVSSYDKILVIVFKIILLLSLLGF
jgi:hypothetical protein